MIIDWLYTSLFLLVVLSLAALMGEYMAEVFSGERTLTTPLIRPLEQRLYHLCGVDESREMSWKAYAAALLVFNILGFIALFLIQELQDLLPLNPAGLGAVRW
ncbi:MAG TPA: potassium-transporting ATPase subunit KdpA, partial [Methanotrichaceae archaeon]|nr:potassium-transporting ATPase subunit KdpA [Methanotrichaceae archaeon]